MRRRKTRQSETIESTLQAASRPLTISELHARALKDQPGLGIATVYNIDYKDAEGDTVNIIGGGLVPTPVAGKVILDDGTVVPFCIGCGGDGSAIGGSPVGSGVTWIQPKSRVYWNIQK